MTSLVTRYLLAAFIVLFCLVLGLTIGASKSFNMTSTQITQPIKIASDITLPYLNTSAFDNQQFVVNTHYKVSLLTPTAFKVTPDDKVLSVRVNDQEVNLSRFTDEQLQNYRSGFYLDLSHVLQTGDNTLEITVLNYGGQFALDIQPHRMHGVWLWIHVIWLLVFILGVCLCINMNKAKIQRQLSYLFIGLFNALQVWVIFKYNPINHVWSDAQRHWEQGTQVLRQDLMAFTDPVMYQLYIGALAKLTLGLPSLVAYFTSLLALFNSYVWYRFFRELQTSKSIALWGCVAISALPSWMSIYSYFMQETLMLPLLGLALWASWRCKRKGTLGSFIIMVCIWVAAGLTRGICIPFAAVCCTWLWLVQEHKASKALYSVLALSLIMGPLVYRSYETVGHFAPHGMGHLNIIYSGSGKKEIQIQTTYKGGQWQHGFASPSMGAKPFYPFSDWQTQRTGRTEVYIDLEKGNEDWESAKNTIDMRFADYLWITKENVIFVLFAESWPDNNLDRIIDTLNSLMRWLWLPLILLLLFLIIRYREKMNGQYLLSSLILAWFIVQVLLPISVNEGRYRKPLEGLLIAQLILFVAAYKGCLSNPKTYICPYFLKIKACLTRNKTMESHDA